MPESNKTLLTELAAYYLQRGEKGITQRYPTQEHFLIVPKKEDCPPPLIWTPNVLPVLGSTSIEPATDKLNLPNYAVPTAVVVPIEKRSKSVPRAVTFGRSIEADVRFSDKSISKLHASISERNGALFIRDLHSSNGTFLNGHRLRPSDNYALSVGSEVKMASIRAMYVNLESLVELVKLVPE